MKKKACFFFLIALGLALGAEDVRPFGYSSSLGFNLGPELKWTRIRGEDVMMLGIAGGFTVNRSLTFGIAAYGVIDPLELQVQPGLPRPDYRNLEMAYAGITTDCVFFSRRIFQFSAGILLGAGAVAPGNRFSHHEWEIEGVEADWFFIVEPELNFLLRISPIFQLGIGGSYRRISSLQAEWIDSRQLKGLSGSISMQFGWHGR